MKRIARSAAQVVLNGSAVVLSPVIRLLAAYGFGSDYLLRRGVLPLPVHFYSPVPDVDDLVERDVWSRRSDLPGVNFASTAQVAFLEHLGERFGQECAWPLRAVSDPALFHLDNSNFSFGCAASLYCMLRELQPRRVVEIGSGNSSKIIASALARNAEDNGASSAYEIVDPYPANRVLSCLPWQCTVHKQRVECMSIAWFSSLSDGDVLFIDSGHTVRIGGDVNFLFLEVIPRLAPGVVVHVHDVNLPYEYDRAYVVGQRGTFRKLWTESYLLQAFLTFNDEWQVLLAMRYIMTEHLDSFRHAFPHYDQSAHKLVSSSFWMRRRSSRT